MSRGSLPGGTARPSGSRHVTTCWPWPGDAPIARARRVAIAYRARLYEVDPGGCGELDRQVRAAGEGWAVPRAVAYDPDEWLTPAVAADLAGISVPALARLRRTGRISARYTGRGHRFLASDVAALIATPRTRK